MNPAVTDTLIIATIGIAGGAALIYIQVLIQWSLRKRHPAPPELPRELVEEISAPVEAPREAAPPPEEVAAPPPRMEAPPEVIAQASTGSCSASA